MFAIIDNLFRGNLFSITDKANRHDLPPSRNVSKYTTRVMKTKKQLESIFAMLARPIFIRADVKVGRNPVKIQRFYHGRYISLATSTIDGPAGVQ